MKPSVHPHIEPAEALRELRSLVGTYLEGSDDAPRAAELLDAIEHQQRQQQAVRAIDTFHATVPTVAEATAKKKRSVGIPYARQQQDPATKTWFVTCPLCALRIDLVARKDSESFTLKEYQDHVAKEHPDA